MFLWTSSTDVHMDVLMHVLMDVLMDILMDILMDVHKDVIHEGPPWMSPWYGWEVWGCWRPPEAPVLLTCFICSRVRTNFGAPLNLGGTRG